MPSYGILTDPLHDILSEIRKIHDLKFDYADIGIEGLEGNPTVIYKRRYEISMLVQTFKQEAIGHTAYWLDLCSDYDYFGRVWIL